jgi:hypothetical protein
MVIDAMWAASRGVWERVLGVAALVGVIGCNSGQALDTTPGLTLTSSVHDTTVARGSRFNWPYVLTWRNQPVDSVLIGVDNPPTDITVDVNASSGTVVGNTDTGFLTVVVGFLDPGTYTVDILARGAAHGLVSIPSKITVTLTP